MMSSSPVIDKEKIRSVLCNFIAWLQSYGDTSQDQYDFWAWRFGQISKAAYYGGRWWGKLSVAPLVLLDTFLPQTRSLIRSRSRFPIADAHYAMAFLKLYSVEANEEWRQIGQSYLRALMEQRCPNYGDYSWGYPFDWVTCFGTFESGTPLITTIPYVYEAFAKGYEATGETEYLNMMRSAATFAFEHISETELSPGVSVCSYTPSDHRRVVNANAYRAFLLTTAGTTFKRNDWIQAATRNLAFVLSSQQPDGSWLYAMDGKDAFIDNFHTCFVLNNLYKAWKYLQDPDICSAIQRGFDFYRKYLLTSAGLPIPFAKQQRLSFIRQELYDYAEGINLCLLLSEIQKDAREIMLSMLRDVLENWIVKDGHFCTRTLWMGKNTIPYHRWAQSQLFLSLVNCYLALEK